jgi:hypothetical protein
MRNRILLATLNINVVVLLVSMCCLDSDTNIFYITTLVSMAYISLFGYANKERWKK